MIKNIAKWLHNQELCKYSNKKDKIDEIILINWHF